MVKPWFWPVVEICRSRKKMRKTCFIPTYRYPSHILTPSHTTEKRSPWRLTSCTYRFDFLDSTLKQSHYGRTSPGIELIDSTCKVCCTWLWGSRLAQPYQVRDMYMHVTQLTSYHRLSLYASPTLANTSHSFVAGVVGSHGCRPSLGDCGHGHSLCSGAGFEPWKRNLAHPLVTSPFLERFL